MSFIRLIPTLSLKNGRIIKTVRFDQFRDIGHPKTMGKVFDSQDVDELIFMDITASQENREPDWENIKLFADESNMPLTLGGGISNVEHIRKYLTIGADKVTLNSVALENPNIISESASMFGSQCIVVSIDAKKEANGSYQVYSKGGFEPTGKTPNEWASQCVAAGAGEILITSIDNEGTLSGYDLDLINLVCQTVNVPVIGNGGCGLLYDLLEVVKKTQISAVACSSLFAFTDNKPVKAKVFLEDNGVKTRPL